MPPSRRASRKAGDAKTDEKKDADEKDGRKEAGNEGCGPAAAGPAFRRGQETGRAAGDSSTSSRCKARCGSTPSSAPRSPNRTSRPASTCLADLREFKALGGDMVELHINDMQRADPLAEVAKTRFNILPKEVIDNRSGTYKRDNIFLGVAFTCGLEKVDPALRRARPARRIRAGPLALHGHAAEAEADRRAGDRRPRLRQFQPDGHVAPLATH